MLDGALTVASFVLLGAGLLLATVGLYGLLRMPDTLRQLHPAGLVTGPATILVLLATVGSANAAIISTAALVIVFVLITSPLSSHAVAQAAYLRRSHPEAEDGDPLDADR